MQTLIAPTEELSCKMSYIDWVYKGYGLEFRMHEQEGWWIARHIKTWQNYHPHDKAFVSVKVPTLAEVKSTLSELLRLIDSQGIGD